MMGKRKKTVDKLLDQLEHLSADEKIKAKKDFLNAGLEEKIKRTKMLIMEWYHEFDGQVYIAFSGGKDSTVLLHIVRSMFPDVPAVFANTGLEYPEIVLFAISKENVVVVRPKKAFPQVLKEYGFPIISKQVAMAISRYKNAKNAFTKRMRMFGGFNYRTMKMQKTGTIPKKWREIARNKELKVTESCCYFFKKEPFNRYENKTKRRPFVGVMAHESNTRMKGYIFGECNAFKAKKPQSKPLYFWTEADIYKYIRDFNIEICEVYKDRYIKDKKTSKETFVKGEKRTGCIFCMYGVHLEEKGNTRFHRLKISHPKLYDYCMDKLGLRAVLKIYLGRDLEDD